MREETVLYFTGPAPGVSVDQQLAYQQHALQLLNRVESLLNRFFDRNDVARVMAAFRQIVSQYRGILNTVTASGGNANSPVAQPVYSQVRTLFNELAIALNRMNPEFLKLDVITRLINIWADNIINCLNALYRANITRNFAPEIAACDADEEAYMNVVYYIGTTTALFVKANNKKKYHRSSKHHKSSSSSDSD